MRAQQHTKNKSFIKVIYKFFATNKIEAIENKRLDVSFCFRYLSPLTYSCLNCHAVVGACHNRFHTIFRSDFHAILQNNLGVDPYYACVRAYQQDKITCASQLQRNGTDKTVYCNLLAHALCPRSYLGSGNWTIRSRRASLTERTSIGLFLTVYPTMAAEIVSSHSTLSKEKVVVLTNFSL